MNEPNYFSKAKRAYQAAVALVCQVQHSKTRVIPGDYVPLDFAVELEEELIAAQEKLAELTHVILPNEFADVTRFHEKMELQYDGPPRMLPPDYRGFRIRFMHEELDEYRDACADGDMVKAFDALIDLVYVALGTAQLQGLPWAHGWKIVHAANMQKERGVGKRGFYLDTVKPEGWVSPNEALAALLEKK